MARTTRTFAKAYQPRPGKARPRASTRPVLLPGLLPSAPAAETPKPRPSSWSGSTLQRHNVQQKDTSSKCITSGNATHAPLPEEEKIWFNITSPDNQHTLLVWGGKGGRKYSLRHLHLLTLFPCVWKEKHYNSPMVSSDAECKSISLSIQWQFEQRWGFNYIWK